MAGRWLLFGCWLGMVALGCQAFTGLELPEESPAAELWEQGQAAMRRGAPVEAISYYQQSLEQDPNLGRNHLSLAAAYLETGDELAAYPHLLQYVTAHPDHLAARGYLAELLMRLDRLDEARDHFEHYVVAAQTTTETDPGALIRCHRRLMEIAEAYADPYAEHLHRGIGLFLLAQARSMLPDPDGLLPTEGLLCKAAGELTLAQVLRPGEARPSWYLYEVWSRLPTRRSALKCLEQARDAAPFSYLTPAEHRDLQMACQCAGTERK